MRHKVGQNNGYNSNKKHNDSSTVRMLNAGEVGQLNVSGATNIMGDVVTFKRERVLPRGAKPLRLVDKVIPPHAKSGAMNDPKEDLSAGIAMHDDGVRASQTLEAALRAIARSLNRSIN